MAKEICISSTPHETRLAILEDDQLAEIYYERENEYTLAGSIYNGRVTRVLPGMQSAFVDVGLERDAFLYVTDFLELEDPEEADELEKASATGASQPPREVRHTSSPDRSSARGESRPETRGEDRSQRAGQKPDQRPDSRQDQRSDRAPQEGRRLVVEPATDSASESTSGSGQTEAGQDESSDPGAKRWRGRRRRRGGRGAAGTPEGQAGSEESPEDAGDSSPTVEEQGIQASASPAERQSSQSWSAPAQAPAPSPRAGQAPVPFVLPGESLRKYGGTAEDESPKSAPAASAPARPASTFKPASLIEAPLAWDGSGLLPGESISRHRTRQAEPEVEVDAEPQGVFSDAVEASTQAPDAVEEDEFFAERTETEPASESTLAPSATHEYEVEEVVEEEFDAPEAAVHHDESAVHAEAYDVDETESQSPDSDAKASHHVDPAAPSGFRLFGLGGKKKTEEPAQPAPAPPAPAPSVAKPSTVAAVSAYAPGPGHIEEEVIEEEEFDAPRHHHAKADDLDLEDYEEETLPAQLRTGDLGELLQEAHLDHKIQLNFDDKNVEDESFDDEEDDEDEQSAAADQPAASQGQDASQQRRDRGGRGRRGGRGAQASPQGGQGQRRGMTRRSAQTSDLPIISDLLKPGQEILVQIAKEPIAKKGARITSHIALPGRFLVFMPTVSHIGVSRKIASDEERQRLKRVLVHERGEATGGFIVRTAAEGASEEDLRADLRFLIHLWDEIKTRSDTSKSPALIYHDLSLIERILRDQVSANFSSIWVDSQDDYERIVRFLNRFSPTLVRRVKLYTKEAPLFEHFGIQDEISKALRSKVWLKSGGSIVINQTEALVAIDINTGKYVGKSARLEDTIVKTNLDAVPEIVRQIRLRDLGGIIVIDFIDMDERKNRFRVLAALEEALKADRAPTKVLQFNDFGLVAITRKRVKQSLERTLSVPCPTCQATGMVKSPTTVCNEIYIELRKMKKHFEGADVLLRVNPETVKVLKSNNASWLNEFEELVGKNILVKSDVTLHPEQFDIQG
ncbi:MAG TPA: Rne/Rng family ribonuclease [Terracidiphilus sp.]|jgi:ribonuclease G|nr:Rne/Rng family ribonuclease [Terracidiphilus sp.]